MVLLDDVRRQVEVNGAYLGLLGYPRSELIGRPVYEFVEDGPLLTKNQWKAMLRKKQFSGVVNLVRQDGSTVKVEFGGHPEVVTGQQLVLAVALKTVRGLRRIPPQQPSTEADNPLSKREQEIVELVAMGLTSSEIASELHVSHNTVRTHVRNSMGKLEARSRAHLVAKTLAEAHHRRTPLNEDRTTVVLPVRAVASDDYLMPERTGSEVRVLLVDDAPSFRDAARELLEHRGYIVVGEADCAESAMRAVVEFEPDAVLLDVRLPDVDGFELAEDLSRARPGLAILLVSAEQLGHHRPRAGTACAFVPKTQLATVDLAGFWPSPRAIEIPRLGHHPKGTMRCRRTRA